MATVANELDGKVDVSNSTSEIEADMRGRCVNWSAEGKKEELFNLCRLYLSSWGWISWCRMTRPVARCWATASSIFSSSSEAKIQSDEQHKTLWKKSKLLLRWSSPFLFLLTWLNSSRDPARTALYGKRLERETFGVLDDVVYVVSLYPSPPHPPYKLCVNRWQEPAEGNAPVNQVKRWWGLAGKVICAAVA